jgi:hypothetical protein
MDIIATVFVFPLNVLMYFFFPFSCNYYSNPHILNPSLVLKLEGFDDPEMSSLAASLKAKKPIITFI